MKLKLKIITAVIIALALVATIIEPYWPFDLAWRAFVSVVWVGEKIKGNDADAYMLFHGGPWDNAE